MQENKKFENVEELAIKLLKESNNEHLKFRVMKKLEKVKESDKINPCKSTTPQGVSRLIVFRVLKDEEARLQSLERKNKKLEEEKQKELIKLENERRFITECKNNLRELARLGLVSPFMNEVLYSLLIKKESVPNLCRRLNVSRDVIYQTKKRGLDKMENVLKFKVRKA